MATINEYKEKLVSVIEEMEKEHNVRVNSVNMCREVDFNYSVWDWNSAPTISRFKVDIEL
jgi:hypothetical protein